MNTWVALFILFFSLDFVYAADISGTYKGSGRYSDIVITPRGSDFYVETCGAYANLCIPVTAVIRSINGTNFDSVEATLHPSWSADGKPDCAYSMSLHISYSNNQIFLSEFSPISLPATWRPNQCPPQSVLEYGNYVEPVPYTKM